VVITVKTVSRNNRGQFTKGNKEAKKSKKGVFSYHSTKAVQSPDTDRVDNNFNKDEYIPFGVKNDFFEALASIYRKSPVHRSLIENKTHYITGSEFISENQPTIGFIENANANQSFRDVHRQNVKSKLTFGNTFIQLVTDTQKSFLSMFTMDATKCRVSEDGTEIIIHPNWAKYKQEKKKAKHIPLFPNFTTIDGQQVSMVHVKDFEPEFKTYGLPTYVAALDAASIGYKTNKWNVSRLDNSFSPSGVLILDGTNLDTEEAEDFNNAFDKAFTGEGNQGKKMTVIKPATDSPDSSKWIPFQSIADGEWLKLHEQSTDELIIAHNWFRSLSGVATQGALGNTEQVKNEYLMAISNIVEDSQQTWIDIYNRIFTEFGIEDEDLIIFNKPPLPIHDAKEMVEVIDKLNIGGFSEDQKEAILNLGFGFTTKEIIKLTTQ